MAEVSFDDTGVATEPAETGWPVPQFKHRLGNHPLWQDFLNELKAQREADIAESNRLADLELAVSNETRI